jgi:hypothetical protein
MFARGLVSLHTPPLLGRKSFEAKSRVSITSKLIENKPFQVLYFGHLRKMGGGGVTGWYTPLIVPCGNLTELSPVIPALTNLFPVSLIIPAHTRYPGEGGLVIPRFTAIPPAPQMHPGRKERASDPSAGLRTGRSACATRHGSPVTGHFLPLSVTSRQYCAPIARDVAKTEAGGNPGMVREPAPRVCPLRA